MSALVHGRRSPMLPRPRPRRLRWAVGAAVAGGVLAAACGTSSVATPPTTAAAASASPATAASPRVGTSSVPARLAGGGALLEGADAPAASDPSVPSPAPAAGPTSPAEPAAPPAVPREEVPVLLAQPGVEAVVATVVAQEGAIQAWAAPPGTADGQQRPIAAVPVRNEFGGRAPFLVEEQVGDWLRVHLPIRPNGSEGWIARSEVTLAAVAHRIEVDLGTRRLRVLEGDHVLLESPVAIGRPSAPTPTGSFYVRDSFAWDPYSVYGPYVLPLSAYSDSIEAINGGEAVIAIHGTNRPESVGRAASLGCLRLDNDTVAALAHLVPVGTPVTITA